MARIVRREVRKRGVFGKIFKYGFIAFNALMVFWVFSYWGDVGGSVTTGNEYERAGSAIGATLGTSFIVFFWLAGAVVLGLFTMMTKGQKIIVEEKVD